MGNLLASCAGAGASITATTVAQLHITINTATGHHAPPTAATAAVAISGNGPPISAPVVSRASAMPL